MDVRRESKHEVIEALRRRYRGAGRVEKGRVSDEAAAVTGYHRRYGQALLRKGVPNGGPRLRRGGRPRVYGWEVEQALVVAAEATGWICGKRLVAALPDLVPALEREGALRLSAEERGALLGLSAATIDRRQAERLTLTRCRADHKNDQAHVEQKNWSVVRQLVGYDRYEGAEAVAALEAVYALLHVYVNGYLPVMKLVGKEREGTRVRKRYDTPQTPYRRAQAAGALRPDAQAALAAQLAATGPLRLRRHIDAALAQVGARRVGAAAPTRQRAVA